MPPKKNDEKPFLKKGISVRDVERFKETVDVKKYDTPKKLPKVIRKDYIKY